MGRTLNLYIFNRHLRMIIYFSLGTAALAFLADFTEFANRTGDLPQFNLLTAFAVVGMRLPFILMIAIPFVVLFATMTTLMNLNQKYELVIARASGVSAWQFLAPMWVSALFVGLFSIFVINPVSATGFAKAEQIESDWRARKSQSSLVSARSPWLRQPRDEGGYYIIGADRAVRNGRRLSNALFIEIDADGELLRRMEAPIADLQEKFWVLRQPTVVSADGSQSKPDRTRIPTNLDVSIITEALVPAEMVPFLSLPRQIANAQSFGIPANPFRMQLHSLIALPVMMIAMTLIAATFSMRFARFGQSAIMIVTGIAAGFVLYVITALGKSFGSAGIILPVVAAWLPVAAALFFGIAYLLHREDG